VLNFLTSTPEDSDRVVEAIIAHPAVRRVNFTGSTVVGRIIAEKAARHLKPALLELGGKAPFVVLDDADIDGAVKAAVFGSFLYQGQICMSTERFVVDETIADEFVSKFVARAQSIPAGDPLADPGCVVGPMVRPESGHRINGLIEDAVSKGAEVVTGGPADDAAMAATIVDKVRPEMAIYDQETFGPITTVVRVSGVEEAIRVANDTEYGLAAAVFGADSTRALQVAMRIQAGHVHVNGSTVQNEAQASLRRDEGQRLRPLRRSCGDQRVHRAQVDHHRALGPAVPVLSTRLRGRQEGLRRPCVHRRSPGRACSKPREDPARR
jgi:acyl-CoA reductase-like NAD-dependent aldehyde dehydrogenase